MQGMAILQQGIVAAQQLQMQRAELDLKQEEFRNNVRTQIVENPAQFALIAEFQPDLAKSFLQAAFPPPQLSRRDRRRIERGEMAAPAMPNYDNLLKGMSHLGNILDPVERNQAATSLLHAEGATWSDFEDPPDSDPGSRGFSFGAGTAGPQGQPGDPGYVGPDTVSSNPMEWSVDEMGQLVNPGTRVGTRDQAETMRGQQMAEAGEAPGPREGSNLTGSRNAGMNLLREQVRDGAIRGDAAMVQAQQEQLSQSWKPTGPQQRVPIITDSVGRAGLLERQRVSGMPEGPMLWDTLSQSVQNAYANPNGRADDGRSVWAAFNDVMPNIQDVGASGFEQVRKIMGLKEDELLTADHMRDYNSFRAVTMHAMRMGMSVEDFRSMSPERLARDFFWATDQRLSAHDIRELNNLDVYTDGKFNPDATRAAQAERWAEIVTAVDSVNQVNQQHLVGTGLATGSIYQGVAGRRTLDALSTHLHRTQDRIANGRYQMNQGRARQTLNDLANANRQVEQNFNRRSDGDRADHLNMLANYVNGAIRDTPGGVAGLQQQLNNGYSLELDLANTTVQMLQNEALVQLQARGLDNDMIAMGLTMMSAGPTPGELANIVKTNAETLDMLYNWRDLSVNERGELMEKDPTVRALLAGVNAGQAGQLGIPLTSAAFQYNMGFLNLRRASQQIMTPDILGVVNQLGGGGGQGGLSPGAQAYLDQRR